MRVLEMQWSRALSLMCEVALRRDRVRMKVERLESAAAAGVHEGLTYVSLFIRSISGLFTYGGALAAGS